MKRKTERWNYSLFLIKTQSGFIVRKRHRDIKSRSHCFTGFYVRKIDGLFQRVMWRVIFVAVYLSVFAAIGNIAHLGGRTVIINSYGMYFTKIVYRIYLDSIAVFIQRK